MLTEVEIVASVQRPEGEEQPTFSLGYGACFGHNEVKAISMAVLDRAMMAIIPPRRRKTRSSFSCTPTASSPRDSARTSSCLTTSHSSRTSTGCAPCRGRTNDDTGPAAPTRTGFRYNFAFIDEGPKREVRRALLKAVALPGHQVPFASPELPIARGWGTGGLQVTMSLIGPEDVLKIIDQGCDGSVNAVNLSKLLVATTGVQDHLRLPRAATLLQSRHRLPEIPMAEGQIAMLQVPLPEPLRLVEPSEVETRRMHAEGDYARMWVSLYEDVVQNGSVSLSWGYPCRVNGHYIITPSPLPRWDIPLLDDAENLTLLGAGREKRVYAIPPHTSVQPLEFEDVPFTVESFAGPALRALRLDEHLPRRDLRREHGPQAPCLLGYRLLRPRAGRGRLGKGRDAWMRGRPAARAASTKVYGAGCDSCRDTDRAGAGNEHLFRLRHVERAARRLPRPLCR